jgi:hypothetical protein
MVAAVSMSTIAATSAIAGAALMMAAHGVLSTSAAAALASAVVLALTGPAASRGTPRLWPRAAPPPTGFWAAARLAETAAVLSRTPAATVLLPRGGSNGPAVVAGA